MILTEGILSFEISILNYHPAHKLFSWALALLMSDQSFQVQNLITRQECTEKHNAFQNKT